MKKRLFGLAIIAGLMAVQSVSAQTDYTWISGGSGLWGDDANWNVGGTVPGSGDTATINAAVTVNVVDSVGTSADPLAALTLGNGTVLALGQDFFAVNFYVDTLNLGATSTITVNNGSSFNVLGATTSAGTLSIDQNTGSGSINFQDLTVTGGSTTVEENTAVTFDTFTQTGGSVFFRGDVTIGSDLEVDISGSDVFQVNSTGSLDASAATAQLLGGDVVIGGDASFGTIINYGADILASGSGAGTNQFDVADYAQIGGSLTIDGDNFAVSNSNLIAGGSVSMSSGSFSLTGSPSVTNTTLAFSGGEIVNNFGIGNNSTANFSNTVQITNGLTLNGGTLNGTGTLDVGAGSSGLTIDSGIMAPGNSIGEITVAGDYTINGGVIEIELSADGNSWDTIVGVDNWTVNGGTLRIDNTAGYLFDGNTSFDIFDFNSFSGTGFDSIELVGVNPGIGFDTSELYSTGVLNVSAVPEPTTLAFGGLLTGGLLMYGRRRRNRKQSKAADEEKAA